MAFWGSGKIFAVSKAMKMWLELNTSIQYYSCSLECIYTHIHIYIYTHTHTYIEGSGTPLQYSCLENPMGGGAWWATVHGVEKSRTRLSTLTFTFTIIALGDHHKKVQQTYGLNKTHWFLMVMQTGSQVGFQWGLSSWVADRCHLAVFSHGRERDRTRNTEKETESKVMPIATFHHFCKW